jgi:5-methylcytosine-specific restriction endonuclease McrA
MICKVCGATYEQNPRGRTKLYCSRACSSRALYKPKVKTTKNCDCCGSIFETAKDDQHFCSSECRLRTNSSLANQKFKDKMRQLYPDGIKRKSCGWCGDTLEVPAQKTLASRKYHERCSLEAQRARYRIKTVKRQSKTKPSRLSADQVLREYGSACHICKDQIDLTLSRTSRMGLTVDHVIPLSKGGSDELDNLRPAHWICNNRKSDKLDA